MTHSKIEPVLRYFGVLMHGWICFQNLACFCRLWRRRIAWRWVAWWSLATQRLLVMLCVAKFFCFGFVQSFISWTTVQETSDHQSWTAWSIALGWMRMLWKDGWEYPDKYIEELQPKVCCKGSSLGSAPNSIAGWRRSGQTSENGSGHSGSPNVQKFEIWKFIWLLFILQLWCFLFFWWRGAAHMNPWIEFSIWNIVYGKTWIHKQIVYYMYPEPCYRLHLCWL